MTDTGAIAARVPDFAAMLQAGEDETRLAAPRRAERVGRPLGDEAFMDRIKAKSGRDPRPAKPGRRKKDN